MRRLLLAVVLVGALAGCDAAIDLEELPTDAPFGLTEIDIPNSEAEIIAAIQAMPAEFDGRQRAGPGHLGASYGETGIFWSISALPASDPVVRDRSGSSAEWVVRQAGLELSGVLEDHALSLDGDLVWFTAVQEWIEPDLPPEYSGLVYVMLWADPNGEWSFVVQATTPEGRADMVREFAFAAASR